MFNLSIPVLALQVLVIGDSTTRGIMYYMLEQVCSTYSESPR